MAMTLTEANAYARIAVVPRLEYSSQVEFVFHGFRQSLNSIDVSGKLEAITSPRSRAEISTYAMIYGMDMHQEITSMADAVDAALISAWGVLYRQLLAYGFMPSDSAVEVSTAFQRARAQRYEVSDPLPNINSVATGAALQFGGSRMIRFQKV